MLTYARWKYALALVLLLLSAVYALPNVFPQDPSVQVTANRGAAIDAALKDLPGWRREGDALVRTAELPTFPVAIGVVARVGEIAESRDHHPDIDIRWRTLHFTLATHVAGGVTQYDIELAHRIDAIVREHPLA